MFNAFKKNFDIPGQWDKMIITTYYSKRKVPGRDWITIEGYLL